MALLEHKVAVVTGAAQGLGFAMAAELGDQGATVVIADLQEEKAQAAAKELAAKGFKVFAMSLDVTDSASVDSTFAAVAAEHGSVDILVNSAGLGQQLAPLTELDDGEWDRVIDVTLTGSFRCCRAAGAIMEQQESGTIVNISSINGQNPAPLAGAYNIAKAGIISLTRTLALELAAYGVRVNCLCPGPVYTDFNKSVMSQRAQIAGIDVEEQVSNVGSAVPLGRWGEPADIANMVAYLAGPKAAWMTGEVVRVSGGMEGVGSAPPKRAPKPEKSLSPSDTEQVTAGASSKL
eukprot:COSAG02_NODE_3464_length_6695_cov_12.759854_8_plen_292_part_00